MKINANGLPTPWPISLINAALAFFGVVTADDKISPLSQFSSIFTTTRCSIALIGSWLALGVFGLNGFQYPELAWLATFSTIIYFIAFREKIIPMLNKIHRMFQEGINNNFHGWRRYAFALSTIPCQVAFFIFGMLFLLLVPFVCLALVFNVVSPPISYLWNIVSLGVHSSFHDFPKSVQFNTSCLHELETSWHITICKIIFRFYNLVLHLIYLGNEENF